MKLPRTKTEIEQERRELCEQTQRDIDDIIAEFHSRLPRHLAKSVGAIYARYSTRLQGSIADQVRTLCEVAVLRENIFVPRELVFVDLAVRGYRDRRPGLDELRAALRKKSAKVLLVFGTNRLFRKAHKAMKFVEEELHEQGIRCLFVQQNIDTASGNDWRLRLQIHAAIDENGTSMYADNIRAAHQGLFLRVMVAGSLPFGYRGEPVPGEFTRRGRPRCKVVIDEQTAPYVVMIFNWYVHDLLTRDEIARRLNDDPNIPPPAKSPLGIWTYETVGALLENARYRAFWVYGEKIAVYQSSKDYVKQVPRDKPLSEGQFEELRIVTDETWYAAQVRLATEANNAGSKPKDRSRTTRPWLLKGIFRCPDHNDRLLQVGGTKADFLLCKECKATLAEKRPLFTLLNRSLAVRLTCEKLAGLIGNDPDLVAQIVAACRQEVHALQQPDPQRVTQLKAREDKLTRSIEANLRNRGESERDQEETDRIVNELRKERVTVQAQIAQLQASQQRQVALPTEEQVRSLLNDLSAILQAAAGSPSDEEAGLARAVIEALTGGCIQLFQHGERKAHRGWLQGRFRLHLLSFLVERVTGIPANLSDDGIEVVIDFKEPVVRDERQERAWQLHLDGMYNSEIATELQCSRAWVTKLLRDAAAERDQILPDGRGNRRRAPGLFMRITDPVMQLYDQGILIEEIADKFACDRATVTKAIAEGHRRRGVPVQDGRVRRKSLQRKVSEKRPLGDSQSGAA